jgi:hypothetical protein
MQKKHKRSKSRLREKPARAPRYQQFRFDQAIARYLGEVRQQQSEPARSHRFTLLLNELFGDLDFPFIHDYLRGLESRISAHEGQKCRVLRGQPDCLYGNLVVEFERALPTALRQAKRQLQRYLAILRQNKETSETCFIPMATDGVSFRVFAPKEGIALSRDQAGEEIEIEQVENFDLEKRSPTEFYFWLDRYFLRREKREPKAEHFLQDFGTDSAAFREASALWLEAARSIRGRRDYRVIYENWQKYLRVAYGTAVGDEHLFVRHTYLATLAKLIVYVRILNADVAPAESETQEIIQGAFFEKKRILNFLEEDFFSWVARPPVLEVTQRIVSRIAGLLFTYNLRELSEDVMKELYQKLVDPEDRHDLGEYYTPDWLAERMCRKLLEDSAEASCVDPACGSGTFLYQLIRYKKKHLPPTRRTVDKILGSVVGIDIHPLAVIISKMNVLLALGDLFGKRTGAVSIQVYLADSIRHPEKQPVLGEGGVPAERVLLNERPVLVPDAVLSSAATLDTAVRVADEFAKSHKDSATLDSGGLANWARREAPDLALSSDILAMLFRLADLFHQFIREPEDTIWAYILRNQYKPTFLRGLFDVVIGNPPWLSFRYVEKGDYQAYLKRLIVEECGLLRGAGHLIAHLELGTLFFVRCADLYLKPTGKIGFVLPRSIFTADQHDRFRKSLARGNTTLTEVWDLEGVTPLFNVPAAVAFGDQQAHAKKMLPGEIVAGELSRKNAAWAEARAQLKFEATEFHIVQQGERSFLSTSRKRISTKRSFYQPHFKEGATIVPRNFWFVEFKADPRFGIDPKQPLVATDARAEAEAKEPYKGTTFEGPIEAEFLYATLLSTDLVPFGHFHFRPVVLPMLEGAAGYGVIQAREARRKGYLRLANWLEDAQKAWETKRGEKAEKMDIYERLDRNHGLTDQDPQAKYVVLYPMSATYLCAATVARDPTTVTIGQRSIPLRGFVCDYKNFYFETNTRQEADFVAGILNSPVVDQLVKPMQTRGLWGPRDICKKVLELPIPEFDRHNRDHVQLAQLAEACAHKVNAMLPNLKKLFEGIRAPHAIGRARAAVRQSLRDELAEIDSLAKEILK